VTVGARVVADINIACGVCDFCRKNAKLFCPEVRQLGVHDAGALAEFVVAPGQNIYILPDEISLDAAAYVEPLACAIHGQDRIGIRAGETILIIGGGPMGLAHAALAKLQGAAQIIVSEPDFHRREIAIKMGADVVVDPINENLDEILKSKTNNDLSIAFQPKIEASLGKVGADKVWNNLITKYNTLTGNKIDTNLNAYVTQQAINGVFNMVAEKEAGIRGNSALRTTSLLQQVFGAQDKK
jgi:threonine dehydrogenase-like Zn-dependent dehydrogenase